jgi:glycerol-3-phosphate dehydrogenase
MRGPLAPRSERFAALQARVFDVLVIGGGITGCAIARGAALRGLAVALVEKGDFASGTSSRSSRLIHGGVRYLEHGHLHLVFESSAERRRLLRLAPHLVRPLQFTWPVYEGARIPQWRLGAGLMLYDVLALFRNVGRHQRLSHDAVLKREPLLRPDGLLGGARYFDAATDDARLTLANALGAAEAGAVVVNHAAVTGLLAERGMITGATVQDATNQAIATVRATVVINATGPWSDDLRQLDASRLQDAPSPALRGSKGAHIAVPRARLGNNDALTLLSPTDGRVLFVLPAQHHAIVGTTDTYTTSSPDDARATNEDVRYLLDAANTFFPTAKLGGDDVVSAWAGIRPLLPIAAETPGGVSREHAIMTSASGLVSITGGKLTTYRVMARDVVRIVLDRLRRRAGPDRTETLPLPGGDFLSLDDVISDANLATGDPVLARHLAISHGARWAEVWHEISRDADTSRLVAPDLPYTLGELRYSAAKEMAQTLGDLLIRRTHVAFETRDHGASAAERVAGGLAPLFGWSAADQRRAIEDYVREAKRVFSID